MSPNVNDLKRGRFLTQKDIERPVLVTITGYKEVNVSLEGAEPDERYTLSFRELEKPMVLNSTNGQIIAVIVGSGEFDDWIDQKIVLYVDPNVSFGGKLVGGLRCRAPKSQTISQPKPATFDRAKSIENLQAAQKAEKAERQSTPPQMTPEEEDAALDAALAEQNRESGWCRNADQKDEEP